MSEDEIMALIGRLYVGSVRQAREIETLRQRVEAYDRQAREGMNGVEPPRDPFEVPIVEGAALVD